MNLHDFADVHTHSLGRENAVVNLPLFAPIPEEGTFSVGVHPWEADKVGALDWVVSVAADPRIVAIGEAGFDRKSPLDMDAQEVLFVKQAQLAQALGKPLIIHNVGGTDRLMRLIKQLHPSEPWVIHGFRGNAQTATMLLRAGFHLSFGEKFNPEAFAVTPPELRHRESDDA